MDTRVGFIGIIIEDRQKNADAVNHILSTFGEKILARTGIPYKEKNISVITLVVDASVDEVGALTGKLGALPGVTVKSGLAKI